MGCLKPGRLILLLLILFSSLYAFGKQEQEEDTIQLEKITDQPAPSPASKPPEEVIAGGYQPIPLDSEYAVKATDEASAAWEGSTEEWKNAVLVSAESQVVAGKNIRLTFEGLPRFRVAVVFFPLDDSPPTVTWK